MQISIEVNGSQLPLASPFNGRQSAIKQYKDCHRLYGWERVEGLSPDKPSMALEFGSATHLFLQERKRGLSLADAQSKGIARLLEAFPKAMMMGELEDIEKHKELARNMWPAYEAHWQDTEQMVPLGQEVKGRVEVGTNTNVFLVFTIDQLVSYCGQLWIVDYKTMARNDDREFSKYEMRMQPTAYVYGASKVLGKRIAGIVIDGLIKTKIPQFRRESYIRSDEEMLEFEAEFVETCREMAWRHSRVAAGEHWKTVFYKNEEQCLRYYRCPFHELCLKDTPINRMAYHAREQDYMDNPGLL